MMEGEEHFRTSRKLSAARRALATPVSDRHLSASLSGSSAHQNSAHRLSTGSQRRRNKRSPPLEESLYSSLESVAMEGPMARSKTPPEYRETLRSMSPVREGMVLKDVWEGGGIEPAHEVHRHFVKPNPNPNSTPTRPSD